MTTRRKFIKIAVGTFIMISLPMGLLGSKKIAGTKAGSTICRYYTPRITIRPYRTGQTFGYEDLTIDPNCGKCLYNKYRPKCLEVFNRKYDN